jgi:anti-sigma regulatory factor (Ser/Thr protein kinase)
VQSFARTVEIEDREIDCLMLVASELMANAVDHGGGGGAMQVEDLASDMRMTLAMCWDGKSWTLSVEDGGGGDLAEAEAQLGKEQVDILEALEDERGRGLFLIKDMSDSFEVRQGVRGLIFEAKKAL